MANKTRNSKQRVGRRLRPHLDKLRNDIERQIQVHYDFRIIPTIGVKRQQELSGFISPADWTFLRPIEVLI